MFFGTRVSSTKVSRKESLKLPKPARTSQSSHSQSLIWWLALPWKAICSSKTFCPTIAYWRGLLAKMVVNHDISCLRKMLTVPVGQRLSIYELNGASDEASDITKGSHIMLKICKSWNCRPNSVNEGQSESVDMLHFWAGEMLQKTIWNWECVTWG